ncbi:unnamed protein product [Microthlaspi erraticum]|uniref:Leucine-rich repeat-containing N-terminal plant-type domain-containing protein n=1 Tax=Microthlaspi erraticum TaxID=1685480 RepID=A0A6D2JRF6_9BRAS|nr:unnamed protein product [Microthlaspi erraticum]
MTIPRPHKSYCFSGIVVTLYFFFLASSVLHTLASSPPMLHYCRHDQRDALFEFKQEFPVHESNSNPSLSSWNKSSDCCLWKGVTYDAKSGKVISLYLMSTPLNNSLKPNSGLFKLRYLHLSNNGFSGSIPQCLRNTINNLEELNLQNNNLSGVLPPDLFVNATRLEIVDVSGNQLKGKLPKSLINCISLELLSVESNRIKDEFPSWLGSLPSLNVLILRSNQFYLRALVSSQCLHWIPKFKESSIYHITTSLELCHLSIFPAGVK